MISKLNKCEINNYNIPSTYINMEFSSCPKKNKNIEFPSFLTTGYAAYYDGG